MSEQVLKLFKCLFTTGIEVVCDYTETKLLSGFNGNFSDFLNKEKHNIFHLMDLTPCCECRRIGRSYQRGYIKKWIFEHLYDDSNPDLPGHVVKVNDRVTQHCLHKFTEKKKSLAEFDIYVLVQILQKFTRMSSQEEDAFKKIIQVRNTVCHPGHLDLINESDVMIMWNELESAMLNLADSKNGKFIKQIIHLSKTTSLNEKDVEDIKKSMEEVTKKLQDLPVILTNKFERFEISVINGKKKENQELLDKIEKRVTQKLERKIDVRADQMEKLIKASFVEYIGQIRMPGTITLVSNSINQVEESQNIKEKTCRSLGSQSPMSVIKTTDDKKNNFENEKEKSQTSEESSESLCCQLLGIETTDEEDNYFENEKEKSQTSEESSESLCCQLLGIETTDEEDNYFENGIGPTDMSIKIDSELIDEDAACACLPFMKILQCFIKAVRKKCIILEIQMNEEAMKNKHAFRKSLRSLLQEILTAGKVDIHKPGTIGIEITIENSLSAEKVLKLKSWISSWKEQIEDYDNIESQEPVSFLRTVTTEVEGKSTNTDAEQNTDSAKRVGEDKCASSFALPLKSYSTGGGGIVITFTHKNEKSPFNLERDKERLSKDLCSLYNFKDEELIYPQSGSQRKDQDFQHFDGLIILLISCRVRNRLQILLRSRQYPTIIIHQGETEEFSVHKYITESKVCLVRAHSNHPEHKETLFGAFSTVLGKKQPGADFLEVATDACRLFSLNNSKFEPKFQITCACALDKPLYL